MAPRPRKCPVVLASGVDCGRSATVLDHKRTGDRAIAVYICLDCARREYPRLFPPPPPQLDLLADLADLPPKQAKGRLADSFVPLDRSVR